MNCHLIAVEVRVECCADQWVDLNSTSVDQDRQECLDPQAM